MKRIVEIFIAIIVINTYLFSINQQIKQINTQKKLPISSPSEPFQFFLPLISNDLPGYFVSPDGSDTNPGTYLQPFRTLGMAADMVNPGDTVFIREGIYNEAVRFTISGTASSPIKILAYPGENPIIDGGHAIPGEGGGLLQITGDYIHASGIEVRNSAYDGIQVLGSYDIVGSMFVHHCLKKGIFVSRGHDSIIEYNRIWRNSIGNEYGQSYTWSSGITVGRDGVSYTTIRHNTVWENWGQGINTYEADHTIFEDNIVSDSFSTNIYIHDATNILCQRNFVYTDPTSYVYPYGSHVGIMMGDERNNPSTNITIINNISYGNNWNYALFRGTNIIRNILIANNTFVNAITSGGVILRSYHQNIRFENNIVQQDGSLPLIVITDDPEVTFSHNLWSKPPVEAASGAGDVIGDPKLAKVGEPYAVEWFELTGLSPAIDKAQLNPEVIVDYYGNLRGSSPDMGAIEYFP